MTVAVPEPPHLVTDLKTLCLATMTAEWRPLAAQATRERQPPAEYLAQLVHLEVTGRCERRIQRRLQEARFPMLKTLDAFQFDAQPELDRDAILQLCSGAFVTEAANVVLVGGVGTGKTHLAIALGMACCQHDYRVRFLTAAEVVLSVPDGRSVTTLINATQIHDPDGPDDALASVVVTLQDLAPLQEIERMRAEFLGMVSHELRTPLTSIKGSAATALRTARLVGPAEVAQFFRIIDEQADRMDSMSEQQGILNAHVETLTKAYNELARLLDAG